MLERVRQLHELIRIATEELESIKRGCVHPGYFVGWYSQRPGQKFISRICSDCQQFLDLAEPKEQEIFIQSENRRLYDDGI